MVCLQERGTWQGDLAMSEHRIRRILILMEFGSVSEPFGRLTAKLLVDKNASNHLKMICLWKKNYV